MRPSSGGSGEATTQPWLASRSATSKRPRRPQPVQGEAKAKGKGPSAEGAFGTATERSPGQPSGAALNAACTFADSAGSLYRSATGKSAS
jgi:hypothetical protein